MSDSEPPPPPGAYASTLVWSFAKLPAFTWCEACVHMLLPCNSMCITKWAHLPQQRTQHASFGVDPPRGLAHTHAPDMLLVPDCRSLSSFVDCAWCSLPLSLTFLHPQFRAARVKCIASHSIESICLLHHGARDPQGAAPTSCTACRQTGQLVLIL